MSLCRTESGLRTSRNNRDRPSGVTATGRRIGWSPTDTTSRVPIADLEYIMKGPERVDANNSVCPSRGPRGIQVRRRIDGEAGHRLALDAPQPQVTVLCTHLEGDGASIWREPWIGIGVRRDTERLFSARTLHPYDRAPLVADTTQVDDGLCVPNVFADLERERLIPRELNGL